MNFEKEFRALPNQRLRFLGYKSGNNYNSNTSIIIDVGQHVQLDIVDKVVSSLMERHEVLRSLFHYENGGVHQRVYNRSQFDSRLCYLDISDKKNIEQLFEDFNNYIFDLENEPAFKCILAKLENKKYIFAMVLNHIIYDMASLKIIEKELHVLYEAFASKKTPLLEPKINRFSDFAQYYYQQCEGNRLKFHLEYFKRTFHGFPLKTHRLKIKEEYLQMPPKNNIRGCDDSLMKSGKGLPSNWKISIDTIAKEYNGYSFLISNEILKKIRNCSKMMKVTPSVFLLASFCFFLKKVNYQDDIVIDIPIPLRENKRFSQVVGWLTSALLIRIQIKDKSFDDLFSNCKNILYEAFQHRYYHPEYTAHLGFDNNISFTTCQLNIIDNLETSVPSFDSSHFYMENTVYDLTFQINMFKDGCRVICNYNPEFIQKVKLPILCNEFIEVLRCQTQRVTKSQGYNR